MWGFLCSVLFFEMRRIEKDFPVSVSEPCLVRSGSAFRPCSGEDARDLEGRKKQEIVPS